MNLVEKLLKIDRGEFNRRKTKKFVSEQLSETMGEKAVITIQSVSPEEILEITKTGLDEKGDVITEKSLEVNALMAAAAVIDPPLKDRDLLKHIGAATPADAAMKLFKGEVNVIAMKINEMAGFRENMDEVDEEIKN